MTANKHTPGPWVSVSVEGGWDGVAEAANRNSTICTLSLNNPDNARLIAAAPELYAAVAAVIDATRAYLPPDGITKEEFISRVIAATDNTRRAEIME